MTRTAIGLVAAAIWAASSLANAAEAPPPQGVVNLAASATAEVPKDLMAITFTTTREGPDANAIQTALKQALDAALTEARKVAKPGQVDVQTGNFSLYPRYTNKGLISGWQGTAELIVQGRDMPAIGQLVGRISSMTVARVSYDLSREVREKSEADVAAQAIARYRAKAAEYAKQFGFSSYVLREVNIGSNEPVMYAAAPMARMKTMGAADESLPVELGKGSLTVSVNGSVQMTK